MRRTISSILVPTDFSAASELALDYAITLADRFGASVHLLHVVEDPFAAGVLGPEVYIGASTSVRDKLIDQAADRLARLVAPADRVRLQVTSEVRVGFPAASICEVADGRRCDLIVMGTHGRTGMAHLLLGSVAEKVVRQAPCPVMTLRSQAVAAMEAERDLFAHEFVPTE